MSTTHKVTADSLDASNSTLLHHVTSGIAIPSQKVTTPHIQASLSQTNRKNSTTSPVSPTNSDSVSIGVMSIASASSTGSDESDDDDSTSEENTANEESTTRDSPQREKTQLAKATQQKTTQPVQTKQSQESTPDVQPAVAMKTPAESPAAQIATAKAPVPGAMPGVPPVPATEEEMDEFLKSQILQYQNTVEQLQEQILSLRNTKKYDLPQKRATIHTKHGAVEIYTPSKQELKILYKMWKDQNNYHHHLDPIFYRPFMKHTLSVLKEYMSEESIITLKVAKLNGVISGFITYLISQESYYDTNIRRYGAIMELHVTREVRGKGIGKYLIDYAERVFELYGLQYSKIQMSTFNKKAIRFYSHLGYVGRQMFMYKRIGVAAAADGAEEGPKLQSKM